ncbi:hypothetical protein DFJ74DRAFT_654696 [Hyaloraphidium curvatum]|nr:hypothetical protein DFJ74DRAFT_654696 [Hyaloraphidium curvatum]
MDRLRHEGTCTKCRGRMCLYLCPFAVPAVRPLRCRSCHPADGDSRLARGQCDTSGNAVAHLVGEAHCGRKHYRCGACGSTSTTRNNFLRHAAGRAHREAMGEVRWRVVSDRVVPAPREEPVEFFVDESDDASDPGWPLEGAGPTSLEAGDHLPPVLHLPCDMSLSLPDAPLVPTLAKDSADSLPSFIPAALPLPLPPLVTENPTPDLEFLRAELGDGCIRALLAAAPACDAFDEFIRMPGGEEEESVLPDAEPSGLYD